MPSNQTSLFYTKVRNFNDFIVGFGGGGGGGSPGNEVGFGHVY